MLAKRARGDLALVVGGLVVALAVAIVLGPGCSPTLTITRTQAELQEKLARRFPVTKEKFLVRVTLSDPKVLLRTGDPRLGLDLAAQIKPPLGAPLDGRVAVLGEPYYDPQQKAFFLHNPEIERVEFPGFDLAQHEKARTAVQTAVSVALASIPIYSLEGRDLKEATARHLLKEVHVQDGMLRFTLGPL